MVDYKGMYSLKIQIHPRIYNQEWPSESPGDFRKSEIIEQNKEEEANRKEFINSMIDIIGSKTNKKEALDTINSLLWWKYSDLIRLDLETLKFHILSLFDNDGEKKENFPSRINEIKKAFGIKSIETLPEEEKRKFDEFKKKNPINAYKDEILSLIHI